MKKTFTGIISVVFLLWFIASIIGMVYFAKTGRSLLCLALFGQYFLVFGLAAVISGIKDHNFNPITLLFVFIGVGTIGAAFLL